MRSKSVASQQEKVNAQRCPPDMSMPHEATIEDLSRAPGKAELVDGKLMLMSPTGGAPGYAGDEIFASLREYTRRTRLGYAVGDNKAFRVNLPRRKSFSPDAAFFVGPSPGMKFFEGAPVFAAEVRSERDYGKKAEQALAKKRADYFAAGTLVVWDVDLLSETVVRVYRASDPDHPTLYRRGEVAEAEPAIPGWSMPVDDLFM
jgi:Uma2 family endonuclease